MESQTKFIVFLIVLIVVLWMSITHGHAADIYGSPDVGDYYESLKMPDTGISCCGEADVYYADKTDACSLEELINHPDCALIAVITDTRPDKRVLPDGRELVRLHIPVGTRIIVAKKKLRKSYTPNPIGHNIVFENSAWFPQALCWEPQSGL